jgi:BirA family biotin operon repressor/biotin-[acetyl-CoA-carboxylase] ligase
VELRDAVASTNDVARALAREGAPAGTVVLAEEQTHGRGRGGHGWHSPRGVGLWLSVLLRPTRPLAELARFTLAGAVAACRACRTTTGLPVVIKWPNDLLLHGRKLGGVLAELRSAGDRAEELVLGFGINVAQDTVDFPPELRSRAISLGLGSPQGALPEREALAAALLVELGRLCARLEAGDWASVARDWERLAPGASGQLVRVAAHRDAQNEYDALTAGVDDLGALRVRRVDDGRLETVRLAGSVRAVEDR